MCPEIMISKIEKRTRIMGRFKVKHAVVSSSRLLKAYFIPALLSEHLCSYILN
jgi:hypothetical protein